MIEAFIFDLDGVITDTAKFHYLAWKELGLKIDIEIDEEFNESLKGISRMESLERILIKGNKQNEFTLKEKEDLANDKNKYYVELIKHISPKDILPGIENLLKEIKLNNIKIGLASASKNATMVLNNLGLNSYFDFIADAAKCKNSKPNPEIFIMAANGLDVDPLNSIGIEDAMAGIDAINSANMYSVGVGDKDSLNKANIVFENTQTIDFNQIVNSYKACKYITNI
ncbi:beta-phosphoglucomutase [Romboutsia lituseburensis]|uniref:Beta-phosphoglucomutase n=1 Tax=Romboutsia lituseburensis DSM 797 TaxID=1121325 RepID=A0A1G9IMR1_9FIRM|nr:beta-phosphoglucomutase [Romboutsia lituseburensis]CEH33829.1 Beta-phosphoglucomutase [Romboutsia lituseburensis]SDL26432.1 beta-phosphoglucomutase [Romboutsia lituseburensis DSM 797]